MIFRTVLQSPWEAWDEQYLWVLQRYARRLIVRIPGLISHESFDGPYRPDEPRVKRWEAAMKMLFRNRVYTAFVIMQFDRFAGMNPLEAGRPFPLYPAMLYDRWAQTEEFRHRLDQMLHELRAVVGEMPIVLQGEDWSARWIMRLEFTPTYLVLDNPFVGMDEAADVFNEQLARPGILRRSRMSRFRSWDHWRMHIKREQLIAAHLPESHRHGHWERRQMPTRKMRPLLEVINEREAA